MKKLKELFSKFGKKVKKKSTFVEIKPPATPEIPERKIDLFVMNLTKYDDIRPITEKVRLGAIVLIDIRDLMAKDKEELKNALDKIKMVAEARGGKVLGISEGFVIVSPGYVEVKRA